MSWTDCMCARIAETCGAIDCDGAIAEALRNHEWLKAATLILEAGVCVAEPEVLAATLAVYAVLCLFDVKLPTPEQAAQILALMADSDETDNGFIALLTKANEEIRNSYPNARLYEADGYAPIGPTIDIELVTTWRFVFTTESGGTAIVTSDDGSFSVIKYDPRPWLQDVVVSLPLKMGLIEAAELLVEAGWKAPFGTVTVRWPLSPGMSQPYYVFGFDGYFVLVGMYDKSVVTGDQG